MSKKTDKKIFCLFFAGLLARLCLKNAFSKRDIIIYEKFCQFKHEKSNKLEFLYFFTMRGKSDIMLLSITLSFGRKAENQECENEGIIVECFEEKWIYDYRCLFFSAVWDELSSTGTQ